MLNHESLPVWMLADAVIGISAVGGLGAVLLVSPFLAGGSQFATVDQLRGELQQTRRELEQVKSEKVLLRGQSQRDAARTAELGRFEREAAAWMKDAQQKMKSMSQQLDQGKSLHQQMFNELEQAKSEKVLLHSQSERDAARIAELGRFEREALAWMGDARQKMTAMSQQLDHEKSLHQQMFKELEQAKSEKVLLRSQSQRDASRIAELGRFEREALAWMDDAQKKMTSMSRQLDHEKSFHQQMLNLRGDLSRTLFVIDISGSMGQAADVSLDRPNWGDDGKPWTYVKNQVDSWLAHLPVGSFRVLCFNDTIVEFPEHSAWSNGQEGHVDARQFLASMEPGGFTFTEAALKRAYQWQPTTIIFFTDGAPSDAKGNLDTAHQQRILGLIAEQEVKVPINVIAVNNYFDPALGSFLHSVAARSGGGFIGL